MPARRKAKGLSMSKRKKAAPKIPMAESTADPSPPGPTRTSSRTRRKVVKDLDETPLPSASLSATKTEVFDTPIVSPPSAKNKSSERKKQSTKKTSPLPSKVILDMKTTLDDSDADDNIDASEDEEVVGGANHVNGNDNDPIELDDTSEEESSDLDDPEVDVQVKRKTLNEKIEALRESRRKRDKRQQKARRTLLLDDEAQEASEKEDEASFNDDLSVEQNEDEGNDHYHHDTTTNSVVNHGHHQSSFDDDSSVEEGEDDTRHHDHGADTNPASKHGKSKKNKEKEVTDSDNSSDSDDGDIPLKPLPNASGTKKRSAKSSTYTTSNKKSRVAPPFGDHIRSIPESEVLKASKGEYTNRVYVGKAASLDAVGFTLCQTKPMMPKSDSRWQYFLRKDDNLRELQPMYRVSDMVKLRDPKDPTKDLDGNQNDWQAGKPHIGVVRVRTKEMSAKELKKWGKGIARMFTRCASGQYKNRYRYIDDVTPPTKNLLPLSYFITVYEVLNVISMKYGNKKTLAEVLGDKVLAPLYFDKVAYEAARKIVANKDFKFGDELDSDVDDKEAAYWVNKMGEE